MGHNTTRVPFTPLDEAVHLLDTASEPWSVQLELELSGHLEEARLRKAVAWAVDRHPMARARQVPARRTDRGYRWEIAPGADIDPLKVVDCGHEGAADAVRAELQSLPFGLEEAPPFRLRLARRPTGDILMMNANHAALDGFGSLRVLTSVARAYRGDEDPQAEVDLAEARDVYRIIGTDRPQQARRRLVLAEKARDLVYRPCRIGSQNGDDRPGYGFHHVSRPPVEAPEPFTVNDLLLAALHQSVAGWNQEHGRSCRRISVLVPVNLRPSDWRDEVATNLVLEARVATSAEDRATPGSVLEAVGRQTRQLKEGDAAALFALLGHFPRLPLWTRERLSSLLWLTGNRLVDTAVLSNLGALEDPPDFGPGAGPATAVWFSAPARMPCGLSLGVATVADKLCLTFRYRHPLWSAAAAGAFVERYLVELDVLAREGACAG